MPRRLLLDGSIVSAALFARQGIAVGSAHATFELAAYIIRPMRSLKALDVPVMMQPSLHVDDLDITVTAAPDAEVVMHVPKVAAIATHEFEVELHLPFSKK